MTTTAFENFLKDKSRASVAHEAHARAHDRCTELGIQLRSAFDELIRAQKDLEKLGIETSVAFDPPLSDTWNEYRLHTEVMRRREA